MVSRCIFAILLSLFAVNAGATTWYVNDDAAGSNNGTSWANAFDHPDSLAANMSGGDTAFFATGSYYGVSISAPTGTEGAPTVYACSSFADTNGAGEYHFARLYGGNLVTGWTQYSGNVYQASHDAAGNDNSELWQDGQWVVRQTSLGAVDAAGEWYNDSVSNVIYAYITNDGPGADPDNYTMIHADNVPVSVSGADYVEFHGLYVGYGSPRVFNSDDIDDNILIRDCKMTHAAGWNGVNASVIYTGATAEPGRTGWRLINDSLGYAWGHDGIDQGGPYGQINYEENTNGYIVALYAMKGMVVDSCTIYGHHSRYGFYAKNDGLTIPFFEADTIRNSTFDTEGPGGTPSSGVGINLRTRFLNCMIYGNTFINDSNAIIVSYGRTTGSGGTRIFNNTFYDCASALSHVTPDPYEDTSLHFKYNVIAVSSGATNIALLSADTNNADGYIVDSNLYYGPGGEGFTVDTEGVSYATWSSGNYSWDVNSTIGTDPGFNNAGAGDFSRPSASSEMNRTYGGQTWTVYGAVQESAEVVPDTVRVGKSGASPVTVGKGGSTPVTVSKQE